MKYESVTRNNDAGVPVRMLQIANAVGLDSALTAGTGQQDRKQQAGRI